LIGEDDMKESTDLYVRLQNDIAALIDATPAGGRLPAEPKLSRQLRVSRATLREAMRSFEERGLIRRRQGMGTFVVAHKQVIESGLEVLESIDTLARRIHLNVSVGDLQINRMMADETQANELAVTIGVPLVQVVRVIRAEGRPVAYLVDLLPEEVLKPEEMGAGFSGSVLDLLQERGTPQLSQSKTEIRAVAASPEVARALEIQRGDVLLFFAADLFTMEGKIIDYSFSYFLPGYFRFHVVRSIPTLKF
jgi:GntR family transcriptional regulator